VAQDYVQADDGTLATQLAELRWSPVDSPYHCDLAFSPSGAVLASAHAGGDIHVWEADSGEHRLRLRGRQESMLAVVFIDERRLAAAGQDVDCGPPVYIWDL
jgi:WD40 repeat protein